MKIPSLFDMVDYRGNKTILKFGLFEHDVETVNIYTNRGKMMVT